MMGRVRSVALVVVPALVLWVVVGAFVVGGSAAVCTGEPPTRIMPLGDSITVGTDGGYRTELFRALNESGRSIDFVGSVSLWGHWPRLPDRDHEGHSGWRINNLQRNIVDWMTEHEPEIILLHIGTNDISNQATASTCIRRLANLLDTIYATDPEVTVYCASVIIRVGNPEHVRVNELYAAYTPYLVDDYARRGFDCRFVNMHAALQPVDLADDVHPTVAGYRKMAVVWGAALEAALPRAAMTITMTPARPGEAATIRAVAGVPGESTHYFASVAGFGSTIIRPLGATLDLASPAYLGAAPTNAIGQSSLTGVIDPQWSGAALHLQAVSGGRVSQVLVRGVGYN